MYNVSAILFQPIELLFLLIILDCIIMVKGFYSSFRYVIQLFLKLLLCMRKTWAHQSKSSKAECPAKKPCIDRNIDEKQPQEANMMTQRPEAKSKTLSIAKAVDQKTCSHKKIDDDDEQLTIAELRAVMEKLGTSYDPDADTIEEKLSSDDIIALFEEQEPSLQELKEAFGMFDENNDGFIDAKEIRKFLCTLCFTEASEADYKRMIRAYDDNGDGLIDFHEFVRLVAKSFT